MMLVSITVIPLLLLLLTVIFHIDSNSSPSNLVNLYDQKIPFDKVLQLIVNQTAVSQNHTHTSLEILLLNTVRSEVRHNSGEFASTSGLCDPTSMKTSIQLCDRDASFIHKVCAQSNIDNGLCPPDTVSSADTYMQKQSISDPQTDAFAYFRLANMLAKLNPSSPIAAVFKIDLTKDVAQKHFGNSSK
jgi:hypothetical protein